MDVLPWLAAGVALLALAGAIIRTFEARAERRAVVDRLRSDPARGARLTRT